MICLLSNRLEYLPFPSLRNVRENVEEPDLETQGSSNRLLFLCNSEPQVCCSCVLCVVAYR